MRYHTKEEFIEFAKVSRSTVDRFYREYTELGNERKDVGKRKEIPASHLKYFDKDLMIKNDQEKDKKIKNLQKIIWLVRDENSLASKLWHRDWVFFGTISYNLEFTKSTCYNKMVKMFNQLKNDLDDDSELELFFTTESYSVRDGNHNHFVINCNIHNVTQVDKFIKDHHKSHRVDLERYNPEEAGLFYIIKDGTEGTDWDILY